MPRSTVQKWADFPNSVTFPLDVVVYGVRKCLSSLVCDGMTDNNYMKALCRITLDAGKKLHEHTHEGESRFDTVRSWDTVDDTVWDGCLKGNIKQRGRTKK